MKVCNEYINHHYIEEYNRSDYFCPKCGRTELWKEEGSGDCSLGSGYLCLKCKLHFYLVDNHGLSDKDSVIEQLKTGITKQPQTPQA